MERTDMVTRRRRRERRVARKGVRFPERRTGFERRDIPGWRGRYQSEIRSFSESRIGFPLVLATIIVFNLIDYLMTLRVLDAGGAELNPIMERLFQLSPEAAALVKLITAGVVALSLLALRRYRRTIEVSLLIMLGYSALMFWHIYLVIRVG